MDSERNNIVQNNNNNYSFIKKHCFCSTLGVLWLCTKAPLWLYSEQHLEHPEREAGREKEDKGGWGLGWVDPLSVAESAPLSATASNVLFPDVTPFTTCNLKSCDSGPTRARSSSPWSTLSWQGLGAHFFSDLLGNKRKHRFLLGGEEKVKVVGSQHVGVNIYPLTLSFSGELGRV